MSVILDLIQYSLIFYINLCIKLATLKQAQIVDLEGFFILSLHMVKFVSMYLLTIFQIQMN